MAKEFISKSGKVAVLIDAEAGVLVVGDASTPLADNAWYRIANTATVSTLPYDVGRIFKTPDNANAITPAIGDDLYPLTLNKICKLDASFSSETGTIDVTDDCTEGYNAVISDGFTTLSGSAGGFFKFAKDNSSLAEAQQKYINKFLDLMTDDGAGAYTITPKNDDAVMLFILKNSDEVEENDIQQWILVEAFISSLTMDNPLKGVQNLDFNWAKGQSPAGLYQRTTNATESVLPF
jgi:hypothetical protein